MAGQIATRMQDVDDRDCKVGFHIDHKVFTGANVAQVMRPIDQHRATTAVGASVDQIIASREQLGLIGIGLKRSEIIDGPSGDLGQTVFGPFGQAQRFGNSPVRARAKARRMAS